MGCLGDASVEFMSISHFSGEQEIGWLDRLV